MNRQITSILAILWLLAVWSTRSMAEGRVEPSAAPDYKLVYWFDWSDPIRTFRHRAYDLRTGHYPAQAVSAWKQGLRQSHPNYAVLLRDVRLADLPGATDEAKLNEAVHRQFSEVVMIVSVPGPTPSLGPPLPDESTTHREVLRPDWSAYRDGRIGPGLRPIDEVYPSGRRPLGSAGFQPGPGPTPTPFPMPYPRPHP